MNEQDKAKNPEPAAAATDAASPQGAVQEHEPSKTLPSSRSTVKSQLDLLRAWAVASGSSKQAKSTPEVAKIAGRDSSTVSSCNGFFAEIGLLKKESRSYIPADEVFEYNRQHEWVPEKAAHKLAPLFRASWAWEAIGGRLSFNPLSEDEVIEILADACSAGPKYKGQLSSLLDFILHCGLACRQDDGKIGKGESAAAQRDTPRVENGGDPPPKIEPPAPAHAPKANVMSLTMSIEVSMDDVSGLGADKVSVFFAEWAKLVNAKAAIEGMMDGGEVDS